MRVALALAPAAAAQQAAPEDGPDKRALETVHFASLDGKTNLTAYLGRHPGDAPRPAVVLMHGCSGLLNAQGRIFGIYRAWMRALFAQGLRRAHRRQRGFARVRPDLHGEPGPRHDVARPAEGCLCRPGISAGAAVRAADRIALMGWSQGGGVVLLTINDKSIGRPAGLKQDFIAAVSFYPGACSER